MLLCECKKPSFFVVVVVTFCDRVLLFGPDWPGTHSVNQAVLKVVGIHLIEGIYATPLVKGE